MLIDHTRRVQALIAADGPCAGDRARRARAHARGRVPAAPRHLHAPPRALLKLLRRAVARERSTPRSRNEKTAALHTPQAPKFHGCSD
jgi:hypothetical protein